MSEAIPDGRKESNVSRHYKDYLAGGNWHGTELKSTVQKAMETEDKCRNGCPVEMPLGDWEQDWKVRDIMARRKQRGGSTFRPGDGIA